MTDGTSTKKVCDRLDEEEFQQFSKARSHHDHIGHHHCQHHHGHCQHHHGHCPHHHGHCQHHHGHCQHYHGQHPEQDDDDQLVRNGMEERNGNQKSYVLEVSMEVAQVRLGGLNTCLRTKAGKAVQELGDKYVLIGPLTPYAEEAEVENEDFDPDSSLFEAVQELRARGFQVVTGRWKVPGNPLVVLLGAGLQTSKLADKYRQEVFSSENFILKAEDKVAEEALVFSYLAAEFVCQFNASFRSRNAEQFQEDGRSTRIVAHFHDWMTGLSIAFLRQWKVLPSVATVYTVHATMLGRHLSAVDADLYGRLREHVHHGLEEQPVVRDFENYHRHQIELVAVKYAHIVTAASAIAKEESECLLRRKPDLMTFNGLDLAVGSKPRIHLTSRSKIDRFVKNHFAGEELGETLYVLSAGRCEFHNKGIDILIKSLAHLNHLLRNSKGNKMTVVVFLLYPAADCKGVNWDTAQRQKDGDYLDAIVAKIERKLGRKIIDERRRVRLPLEAGEEVDSLDIQRLDEAIFLSHQTAPPPVATHHVANERDDPVLGSLRFHELRNGRHDRVKVIYCPKFDGDQPLMGMAFQDMLSGCDLGVFPGRYSWGYTPALCANYGTPSVVSDSSGYGTFVSEENGRGIFILPLKEAADDTKAAEQVASRVFDYAKLSNEEKEAQREYAKVLSGRFDWSVLIANYRNAWGMGSDGTTSTALVSPVSNPSNFDGHKKNGKRLTVRKSIGTSTTDLTLVDNSLNEAIERRNASVTTDDLSSSFSTGLEREATSRTNPPVSSNVDPSVESTTDQDLGSASKKDKKKKKKIPKVFKRALEIGKSIRNMFRKKKKRDRSEE